MWGAIASGALGAGMGLYELIQGAKQTKKGNQLLSEFDRQELTNAYKNIGISTYGSDLIREETARNSATMMDAARSGGVRGVASSLGQIQQYANTNNARAAADLDNQSIKRDYTIAGDDVRIQSMQEQRDNMELEGIGQMINNGKQDVHKGLGTMMNAGMGLGNAFGGGNEAGGGLFSGFANNSFGGYQVGGLTSLSPMPSLGNFKPTTYQI